MDVKRLFLVDGTALAYRSYYAFIRNPLVTSKGLQTGAVFGSIQALLKLMQEEPDGAIAVAWDLPGKTFRHQRYPDYKATRQKMPSEMAGQLPYVEAVVRAYGIPFIALEGFEADDVIGTLAIQGAKQGYHVAIVAGDKDFMQLIGERISLWIPRPGGRFDKMGREGVIQKLGVPPDRVIDLLGLMGDSSDNVPGIRGVGPKTATRLLARFATLEEVLERSEEAGSPKLGEKIRASREQALLSKELVTIDTNVAIDLGETLASRSEPDFDALTALLSELEFEGLLQKVLGSRRQTAGNYRRISSDQELDSMIESLDDGPLAIEAALEAPTNEMTGLAFSQAEGEGVYVPLDEAGGIHQPLGKLAPFIEDGDLAKGGHDAKRLMHALASRGVMIGGLSFDTMLEAYLVDPAERRTSVEAVALRHLGLKTTASETWSAACERADFSGRLKRQLAAPLADAGLDRVYREIELPLVPVLTQMETFGVKVDAAILRRMSEDLGARLDGLVAEIHELSGVEFNVASPKQLGRVLFETLKIQGKGRVKKTRTGYSTEAKVLAGFASHPVVSRLLEHRNLAKLKNTYLDALLDLISERTGRIHTSYNQAVAATGRLSSSNPNLQNIPIRTAAGRKIRKAFVAEQGCLLLSADYSQIELRILAHLSEDEAMIRDFAEDRDIHAATAARLYGKEPAAVSKEERNRAKAINFGVVYGMGPRRLGQETGLALEEARRFIDQYFETYPGVRSYLDRTLDEARRDGYVTTLMGRRRSLPELHSSNGMLRASAENAAVNTPIQGSAADLIKKAMINVSRRLQETGARMILQVHDELVIEVPAARLDQVSKLTSEEMQAAMDLAIPLKVDLGSGENWLEAHG